MNYEQILAKIATVYADEPDIVFLCEQAANVKDTAARNQLADAVSVLDARLTIGDHYEVSKWGVLEDTSRCREIIEA